jgi:dTDP-4-dehydrorhamnose 3,5-epimerase
MEIIKGDIPGILIIKPRVFVDDRGQFSETYNKVNLLDAGFNFEFVQDNESFSRKGVVRALHYQNPPFEQGKLVRVVKGRIADVAVDIRKGSPYYGKWQKVELSAENHLQMWIPPGFAHGFVSLEENTIVNYKCTNPYHKESEGSIRWNDPDINVDWGVEDALLSERDLASPLFKDFNSSFVFEK